MAGLKVLGFEAENSSFALLKPTNAPKNEIDVISKGNYLYSNSPL